MQMVIGAQADPVRVMEALNIMDGSMYSAAELVS
jgi:hypothetical protein